MLDATPPSSAPRALECLLDGRYLIERELGRGGMGAGTVAERVRRAGPLPCARRSACCRTSATRSPSHMAAASSGR